MHNYKPYHKRLLTGAIMSWMTCSCYLLGGVAPVQAEGAVYVTADKAHEEAKYNSQQVSIITKKDIEQKQAKSLEDIIFTESGVSRTVDSMGRVGVSIRGAEARHTLILVDGQAVLGDLAKFSGAADEVMRLGTENVERIEIVQGSASAKYGSDAIGGVINIITKKAAKKPTIQINGEGSRAKGGATGYGNSNFFLRADSGSLGKLRVAISGSKRDIMPVLATRERRDTGDKLEGDFKPNALRFYGDTSDIGLNATYDISKNHNIQLRLNRFTEDLVRDIKNTTSPLEPQRHFKRDSKRNTLNMIWNGRSGVSDWKLEVNHSRINENDISLINYTGRSAYEGKNELRYIDDVDHRQTDIRFNANTAIGDKHTLSWGLANTYETGSGSRLKSSPNTRTRYIDAWDYDKNLLVAGVDRLERRPGDKSLRVYSHIHDYKFKPSKEGLPIWDKNYEYYGYSDEKDIPPITYEYFREHNLEKAGEPSEVWNDLEKDYGVTDEDWRKIVEFNKALKKENNLQGASSVYVKYFTQGESVDPAERAKAPKYKGVKFLEKYRERDQRITEGEGAIRKRNFYLADAWQVNKDLLVQPTIRLDQSSLFGNHFSWNLGATYNVNSNAHRRLKANIGTGYSEPGMGELWYNWQMFASTPVAIGAAKMGWYWAGNPNLKPEVSKNIDLSFEGEGKNDYARVGLFHNRIRNYMSVYFTGKLQDWAPQLSKEDKWMQAPDLIYSFKNIGKAQITGLQLEWKHKFGSKWSTRFGWTRLQALNQSDPTMPHHLLDRPTNKIDFGITFETKKWNAQIWADYYHKMLDSNTQKNKSNYWISGLDEDSAVFNVSNEYEEKSYGTWNAMIQRKFDKDSLIYFGINNIFNHRDDDRATQSRVYRFGMNIKFGSSGTDSNANGEKKQSIGKIEVKTIVTVVGDDMGHMHPFLERPFDKTKKQGVTVIGDYRTRLMAHGGSERPQSLYTSTSYVGNAAYNLQDKKEHGLEQRVRVGVDARINDNTNVKLIASASGAKGVDTTSTTVTSQGFNHQRIDQLDVTRGGTKWDFSIGRLSESIGTTGYWFSKTFDGLRAVWTDDRNQFRAGIGSFKGSTGVTDSAYNHSTYATYFRAPTLDEFIGLNTQIYNTTNEGIYGNEWKNPIKEVDGKKVAQEGSFMDIYRKEFKGKNENLFFMEQLSEIEHTMATATEEEKMMKKVEILRRMAEIVGQAYPELVKNNYVAYKTEKPNTTVNVLYEVEDSKGNKTYMEADMSLYSPEPQYSPSLIKKNDPEKEFKEERNRVLSDINLKQLKEVNSKFGLPLSDAAGLSKDYIDANAERLKEGYAAAAEWVAKRHWNEIYKYDRDQKDIPIKDAGVFSYSEDGHYKSISSSSPEAKNLTSPVSDFNFKRVVKVYTKGSYVPNKGSKMDEVDIINTLKAASFNPIDSDKATGKLPYIAEKYVRELIRVLQGSEQGNTLPREALEKVIGKPIKMTGLKLERDVIPAIDKAIFAQYKTKVNSRLGIQAWFLHSIKDRNLSLQAGHLKTKMVTHTGITGYETDWGGLPDPDSPIYGDVTTEVPDMTNDVHTTNGIANVFGIGFQYQLGNTGLLSFDYGQNRTDFGRYMNGHTIFDHVPNTADFTVKGHSMGGTPHFWTARLDIGQSDYTVPGSWNAFIDYKYFQHGSFFGGNGTGAVPDRYLDGIRSFTLGGGYVPRKDFLIEAFYTFDAKGIGQRDTLYGGENFKLGNYTRIQGTYKF
ncbi:TonB-dependent siderophore receptor [Veillonella sp. VA139]|uniref:TonB-dependent receptor plug domain-containing protein n=1 Tax=Veillonella sp. VA139 TaxID=741830 RepID=UPI000F8D991C|nr:TonB-dependent receptor [Veillonella sp. VA139]